MTKIIRVYEHRGEEEGIILASHIVATDNRWAGVRLLRGHALTLALSRRAAGEGIKMKGPFFARNDGVTDSSLRSE